MENAISKAIRLAKNQSGLAKVCGISPQALGAQIKNGNILPKYCIKIENEYPGQISRYELNPEHFGNGQTTADCVVIVLQNFKCTSKSI